MISSSDMPVPKRERPRAEPADRARGDLDEPRARRVQRAARRGRARPRSPSARAARAAQSAMAACVRRGQPRGRDVDRLLEERAVERVGLVEERQRAEAAARRAAPRAPPRRPGRTPRRGCWSAPAPRACTSGVRRMAAMRAHAAANSAGSSARMTPRLAESTSGLSTHGYGTRRATLARIVVHREGGEGRRGTPAAASRSRISSLLRVGLDGGRPGWRAGRARRRSVAAGTVVSVVDRHHRVDRPRRARTRGPAAAAAAGSSNGSVSRCSGNSPAITFGALRRHDEVHVEPRRGGP